MKSLFALMSMAALLLAATPAWAVDCTTDDDCAQGEVCVAGTCAPDLGCTTDDDCLDGEICVENVCMPDYTCTTDDDCLENETCVEGACVPVVVPDCTTDDDCADGETCVEGACVPGGDECVGCAPWQTCEGGVCTDPASAGDCEYGGSYIAAGCQGTDWIGCCGGDVLYYCDDQSGACPLGDGSACVVKLDCGADAGVICSWGSEYFVCTEGETPVANPDGDLFCEWYSCEPNCAGKACGNDGCGGSCGDCADGEGCTDAGQCDACATICTGYECGEMGGCDCGTCADGLQCMGNMCVAGDSCAGACGGASATGCYCDEACADYGDCCPDVCDECPDLSHCGGTCTPDCTGKVCGDDGCGGTCGDCPAGEGCDETQGICVAATCEGFCGEEAPSGCWCDTECAEWGDCCEDRCDFCPEYCTEDPCTAACADKCGTVGDCECGGCAEGELCEANACVPGTCTPDCTGMVCGDDGCGGSCGDCAEGEVCDMGTCGEPCVPECTDMICGDDGCGGTCGECGEGELCNDDGTKCVDVGGEIKDALDDATGCATGESVPTAGLIVLLGVLGLAIIRRRVQV